MYRIGQKHAKKSDQRDPRLCERRRTRVMELADYGCCMANSHGKDRRMKGWRINEGRIDRQKQIVGLAVIICFIKHLGMDDRSGLPFHERHQRSNRQCDCK